MLKFDLKLASYKVLIMQHLKEAEIINCSSFAK